MNTFTYRGDRLYARRWLSEIAGWARPAMYRARRSRHSGAPSTSVRRARSPACYAVKANSNLALLNVSHALVPASTSSSVGELERVLAADGVPAGGVFRRRQGVRNRARARGRHCQCRIGSRAGRANEVAARLGQHAPVSRASIRTWTPRPILISRPALKSKFGIPMREARAAYHVAQQLTLAHRGCGLPHRLAAHRARRSRTR